MSDGTLVLGQRATAPTGISSGYTGIYADNLGGLDIIDSSGVISQLIPANGWVKLSSTFTYGTADSPTFTMTATGDLRAYFNAGVKWKLTQSASIKYFIQTADVSYNSGTNTSTITLYGGTDYTLANATISDVYYGVMKSPIGFPLNPDKWSVTTSGSTDISQLSPSANTFYNMMTIVYPVGLWNIGYKASGLCQVNSDGTTAGVANFTISLSSGSASEISDLSTSAICGSVNRITATHTTAPYSIYLPTKATYYLNIKTTVAGFYNIQIRGSVTKTVIYGICGYL